MTVSATSPIDQLAPPAPVATASTSAGRTRLAENFDMFLTLLTTQMKNQDPTSPMDSNQFMAQLVQMTGVEQQLATNDLLKQLVSNTSTSLANVVDLIGKEVRAATNEAGLANGQAKWGYTLSANAADVKIEVLDSTGFPVRTLAGAEADMKAGDHSFVWDGKNDHGAAQPDGVYTLRVTAKDAGEKAVPLTTYVQGVVTGIQQENGQGIITLNGAKVPLSAITSIAQATPATSNTSGSGGGEAATGDGSNNKADQTSA